MKKKGIELTLCLALFAALALGSGSSGDKEIDKEIASVEGSDSEEEKTEETKKSSDTKEDNKEETVNKSDEPSGTKSDNTQSVTVDEMVVVDQDSIKVTIKGMGEDFWGPQLKLLIENNSDQSLVFQVRDASVNGFMTDTMISEDVAPGKKANSDITFSAGALEECGITTFAEMEFKFHIFTSDKWDTYLDTDVIRVETSAYGSHEQTIDDSGEVFYDKDGIKIIGKGISTEDSIFGPGLIMYIENNSGKDFTVQARDTSINGFLMDPIMSTDVIDGKKAITALTFMSSELEENGITDITSVETSFHVFESNGWDTIVDTEPITINF